MRCDDESRDSRSPVRTVSSSSRVRAQRAHLQVGGKREQIDELGGDAGTSDESTARPRPRPHPRPRRLQPRAHFRPACSQPAPDPSAAALCPPVDPARPSLARSTSALAPSADRMGQTLSEPVTTKEGHEGEDERCAPLAPRPPRRSSRLAHRRGTHATPPAAAAGDSEQS